MSDTSGPLGASGAETVGMGGPLGRENLPDRIDKYRIISRIGEGGMGVVYLAEQDNPRRTVALKVINVGIVTQDVLARFEHEAHILGKLQHPGIAQIFEAGTFESGSGLQPFFAMELVRGHPLSQYATIHDLSTRQRLELLAKVADAVQHAHQRGIIHRDLKPSNVLVDESGQPKILDFGVARAADTERPTSTPRTNVGQLVGTVPYMSPEQASGDPDDLDTRSDVYALGVVAYELLSGRLPHELSRAAVHEAVRVIREQTPRPLSTLNPTLRGDVETIVGKALEKDRQRRYQSASALSADIRRYLNDEPIAARPPSAWYQLRKFARRNKALVGAAAAVLLSLVAGVIATGFALARAIEAETLARERLVTETDARLQADDARAAAEVARDEAQAVVAFLSDMLAAADPAQQGRDVRVREVLDNASQRIGAEFADRPLVEARLRHTMAETYRALGLHVEAEEQARRALELRRRELGARDPETLRSMVALAMVDWGQGRYDQAQALYDDAIAAQREVLGDDHEDTLTSMSLRAGVFMDQGRWSEAETQLRDTLERQREVLGPRHRKTLATATDLARVYMEQSRFDDAEQLYLETLDHQQRLLGDEHPDTLLTMLNLGSLLVAEERYADAERHLGATVALQRRVLGEEHPLTLSGRRNLATAWTGLRRFDEAEAELEKLLEIRRRVSGPDHPETLMLMGVVGLVHREQGDFEAAQPVLAETIEAQRAALGREHPSTLVSMTQLAEAYRRRDRFDVAVPLVEEVLALNRRLLGPEHRWTLKAMWTLGTCYRQLGRFDEAEPLLVDVYETRRRVFGEDEPATIHGIGNLALLRHEQGRLEESEALYRDYLAGWQRVVGSDDPRTLTAMNVLAGLLRDRKRYDDAELLYVEALEASRRVLGADHPDTLLILMGYGMLAHARGDDKGAEQAWVEVHEGRKRALGLLHPATMAAAHELASLFIQRGMPERARSLVAEQLAAEPSSTREANELAWVLLTCEPTDLQDPQRALDLARAINEASGYKNPHYLDTLALALHRAGDPAAAVVYERKALELAPWSRHEEYQEALARYEASLKKRSE